MWPEFLALSPFIFPKEWALLWQQWKYGRGLDICHIQPIDISNIGKKNPAVGQRRLSPVSNLLRSQMEAKQACKASWIARDRLMSFSQETVRGKHFIFILLRPIFGFKRSVLNVVNERPLWQSCLSNIIILWAQGQASCHCLSSVEHLSVEY